MESNMLKNIKKKQKYNFENIILKILKVSVS